MGNYLFLDTSAPVSTVAVVAPQQVLAYRQNHIQQDHGKWINIHIQEVLEESGITLKEIETVALCNGPGSYTGLRIALSAAKGICYAGQKNILPFHRFLWQFFSIEEELLGSENVCLIHARANEYYLASYSIDGQCIQEPQVIFLPDLEIYLTERKLLPLLEQPSGSEFPLPFHEIITNVQKLPNLLKFINLQSNPHNLFTLEPFYLKNVHINKINNL